MHSFVVLIVHGPIMLVMMVTHGLVVLATSIGIIKSNEISKPIRLGGWIGLIRPESASEPNEPSSLVI